MENITGEPFAQRWWDFMIARSFWEDGLCDLLGDSEEYDRLGADHYDESLEIIGATNDWRLNLAQQTFLRDAGFRKVYVNHADKWETHYAFGEGVELPVRGWRRLAREGGFDISFWPNGWDGPGCSDWLSSGYMRIVPDPLDPKQGPAA